MDGPYGLDAILEGAIQLAQTQRSYDKTGKEDGPAEWGAALQRAFDRCKERDFETGGGIGRHCIIIDDRRSLGNVFLMNTLAYGLDKHLIHRGDDIIEEQYSAYTFRFTSGGQKKFGKGSAD